MPTEYGDNWISRCVKNCEDILEKYRHEWDNKPYVHIEPKSEEVTHVHHVRGERIEIVRTWIKQHPGEWITARRVAEDLGISSIAVGNTLRRLSDDGDPVEVRRRPADKSINEYRWDAEELG